MNKNRRKPQEKNSNDWVKMLTIIAAIVTIAEGLLDIIDRLIELLKK